MKKHLLFITLLAFGWLTASAAVVTLRSGKVVHGEVLVNNEEVVIIKTAEGNRFQYPASEVVSVKDSETEKTEETQSSSEEQKIQGRKTSILVSLVGGGTFIPQQHGGGHVGGEIMIGSRYIGSKSLFLGGGIGVHGLFAGGKTYTFLPLQLAVKVPFMEGKHSPYAGATVGYGFGLNKGVSGGIYTGAEVGYRYAFSSRSSLLLSLRAQFQQSTIETVDAITDDEGVTTEFATKAGRSFVTLGVLVGITF